MKVMQSKRLLVGGTLGLVVGLLAPATSFGQAAPAPQQAARGTSAPVVQSETAEALLARVDRQNAAFTDALFRFKMVVKSSSGAVEREVEFTTKQKGNQKRLVRFLFVADPPHDTEAVEVVEVWTEHAAAVPDADPCRSTTDKLRAALDNQSQPLTLLVDEEGLVRQAFVGTIKTRGLASAMERLLKVLSSTPRRLR